MQLIFSYDDPVSGQKPKNQCAFRPLLHLLYSCLRAGQHQWERLNNSLQPSKRALKMRTQNLWDSNCYFSRLARKSCIFFQWFSINAKLGHLGSQVSLSEPHELPIWGFFRILIRVNDVKSGLIFESCHPDPAFCSWKKISQSVNLLHDNMTHQPKGVAWLCSDDGNWLEYSLCSIGHDLTNCGLLRVKYGDKSCVRGYTFFFWTCVTLSVSPT